MSQDNVATAVNLRQVNLTVFEYLQLKFQQVTVVIYTVFRTPMQVCGYVGHDVCF